VEVATQRIRYPWGQGEPLRTEILAEGHGTRLTATGKAAWFEIVA
jgi:hypothetical protein